MPQWDAALGRDNPGAPKPEPSMANPLPPNSGGDLQDSLHHRWLALIAAGGINGAPRF